MGLEEDWDDVAPPPEPTIEWLKQLQEKLWPPEQKAKGRAGKVQLKLEAKRQLSDKEWELVQRAITTHKLVVEMIDTNMFGGVGIRLYEHPPAPGVDEAGHLVTLTEEHVLGPTGPSGGNCSEEAYELFFALASTEDNRRWCKQYRLEPPRELVHYCY